MFSPYLGFVKDRLSSWLSVQTLNTFGAIIGKLFNFGTHQLCYQGIKSKKKTPTKSGSLNTTALGGGGGGRGPEHPNLPLFLTFLLLTNKLFFFFRLSEIMKLNFLEENQWKWYYVCIVKGTVCQYYKRAYTLAGIVTLTRTGCIILVWSARKTYESITYLGG